MRKSELLGVWKVMGEHETVQKERQEVIPGLEEPRLVRGRDSS